MKKSDFTGNVKLGLFVIAGVTVLIIALYLIGRRQNIFGSTISIKAQFSNVNGLMPGNNVRYGGISIGTVDEIEIINDSVIVVTMLIEKDSRKYIKKNARAGIGNDGLMGNRLINLISTPGDAAPIDEGDVLQSVVPVETDEMVRTLSVTNDNLAVITSDLKNLTRRITKQNTLVTILTDTSLAGNVQDGVADFRQAAYSAARVVDELNRMLSEINRGKGVLGTLVNDTTATANVRSAIQSLMLTSDTLLLFASEIKEFSEGLNEENGLMHTLTKDSVTDAQFRQAMEQIQKSTVTLEENLKAMRSNFLFRKYFRKQEKENKK